MIDTLIAESPYVRRAPRAHRQVRLFCFPHAGAGAGFYSPWSQWLPDEVELIGVQLPGREDRIREQPFTSVEPLLRNVSIALRPYLTGPFAFFGHSGGALLAYELARALAAQRRTGPAHLFLSGQIAAHLPAPGPPLHHLPEPQFREAVRELGGTSTDVLHDSELMDVLSPTLRADFALWEQYKFEPGPPLPIPITAFAGDRDVRAPADAVAAWSDHTSRRLCLHTYEGDHFYIYQRTEELAAAVAKALLAIA